MVWALPVIAGGLATFFTAILKHPLVVKMLTFSFFVLIIKYAMDFIKDMVSEYIVGSSLLGVASYLGILDGISLYITIVVAGFGVKQVLAFIRS